MEFYYLAPFKMAAVKRAWFWKESILLTLMACHFDGTIFLGLYPLFLFVPPLEDLIGSAFIPKLLGREIPGTVECDLFSLPVRLGGLGLFNPTVTAV